MPELAPFRGLLFDHAKVTPATAVAPPSAVHDPGALARLTAVPHSVARLFAGAPGGDGGAAALAGWRADGTVSRDPYRAIFRIVETAPAPPGVRPAVRRGVIGPRDG